jgi:hypothetical protein
VDGEEFTNKIQSIQGEAGKPEKQSSIRPDVPDSQGFQAFSRRESQRFSSSAQGPVNHVSQAPVNHADE